MFELQPIDNTILPPNATRNPQNPTAEQPLAAARTYRLDNNGEVARIKVDEVRCPWINLAKAKRAVGDR